VKKFMMENIGFEDFIASKSMSVRSGCVHKSESWGLWLKL